MVKSRTFSQFICNRRIKFAFAIRVFLLLPIILIGFISYIYDFKSHYLTSVSEKTNGLKLRKILNVENNDTNENLLIETNRNCTPPAILNFPNDGLLNREHRQQGWIVVNVLISLYCFWLLALVCDQYFVPAIEMMCKSISNSNTITELLVKHVEFKI